MRQLFTLMMMLVSLTTSAQKPFDLNVWEKKAPHQKSAPNDTARIRVFLPNAKRATGRAVVICPGGGYSHLAMEKEGYQWGPFFNNLGIAAIVLKYRMPNGNHEVPISDAEEAMRIVRRMAEEWHINPEDVGIMGFSAGGHLASTIATHAKGDAKPNFQILFYPVITMMQGFTHQGSHDSFLGKEAKKKLEQEYSNDMQVTRLTPRAWIALSDDDRAVAPANGVNYYMELYRHDVPASLHVYPSGGHGWGILDSFPFHVEMELELRAWLQSF